VTVPLDTEQSYEVLKDEDELLYRQVHPSFIRDGRPSSQAFRPTRKDEGKLSVSRSTLTSPRQSFELFTNVMELKSAGVWGMTVGECNAESLSVRSDPLVAPPAKAPDPSHAVVDFSTVTSNGQIGGEGVATES
jgi:hypothetical protein